MQGNNDTFNEKPEFKPGNTPYLKLGNEILNDNIPWADVLNEILLISTLNISQIAAKLRTSVNTLRFLCNGNACALTFQQGAKLLTIHEELYGE